MRRRMGMESYGLGDRYITPDRRLSKMLLEGNTRKGKPAYHWSDTLGRIAQQLAGGYLAGRDRKNQNAANEAFTKVEADSFTRQPMISEEQARGSNQVGAILDQYNDQNVMEGPMVQENVRRIGKQQDRITQAEDRIKEANNPGTVYNNPADRDKRIEFENNSIANANDMIDQYGDRFNDQMAIGKGHRDIFVDREIARQREASEQNVLDKKMPQSEYSMQNLRELTDNPYAQRLLQGLMMQSADRDYASGLAETQFERKKEIAQLPMSQKQVQQKKDLLKPTRPKTVKTAKGVFILNDDGTLGNKLGDPHSDFMNPLDQAKLEKLKMDKIASNKESKSAQIKDQDALIALKRKTGMLDDTIERAKKNINWWSTGAPGTVSSLMPNETDRSNLDSDLLTLKANLGFDSLQQMRENSKTGGALGNVSENENLLLQAINGALDPKNRSQLEDNLDRIKALYPQVLKEKEDTYSRVYGEAYNPTDKNQKNAPPPPSGFEVVN